MVGSPYGNKCPITDHWDSRNFLERTMRLRLVTCFRAHFVAAKLAARIKSMPSGFTVASRQLDWSRRLGP